MGFSKEPCTAFIEKLGSKEAAPGGGGACAFVGSVAAALANMVSGMTTGKKQYAQVEQEMYRFKSRCDILQMELLALVDRDAEVVRPLAEAYQLPADTAEEKRKRARALEEARRGACAIPMEIMEKCCEVMDIVEEVAEKGAVSALSDAGVAAVCAKAAIQGAAMNIFINTKPMTARKFAAEMNEKANALLETYLPVADRIFEEVCAKLS